MRGWRSRAGAYRKLTQANFWTRSSPAREPVPDDARAQVDQVKQGEKSHAGSKHTKPQERDEFQDR